MFTTILDPFYWPTHPYGRKGYEEVLRVEFAANAESAAYIVFDELDLFFGKPELLCQDAAVRERNFRRAGHGQPAACCIPFSKQAPCFHRHCGVTMHAETLAPDI